MTHKISVNNIRRIKKAIPQIESKIKIKLLFRGGFVSIKGNELSEYLVEKIIKAVDFGFEIEDALLLKNEDYNLEFIKIRDHTPRKNLTDVRGRIIGTDGRVRRTLEELTGGAVVLNNNVVGLIIDSEHLSHAVQGIKSLIQGSKHGNVFSYLEKQNVKIREMDDEDLGLKEPFKKIKFED
jgi:ribosomal RNA assembly protein